MIIDFEYIYRKFEKKYWLKHHSKRYHILPNYKNDESEEDDYECSYEENEEELMISVKHVVSANPELDTPDESLFSPKSSI